MWFKSAFNEFARSKSVKYVGVVLPHKITSVFGYQPSLIKFYSMRLVMIVKPGYLWTGIQVRFSAPANKHDMRLPCC